MTGHPLDASTGTQPTTKPQRPAHVTGYRDIGPSNRYYIIYQILHIPCPVVLWEKQEVTGIFEMDCIDIEAW